MHVLFATSNPHKLAEVRVALEGSGIHVFGLDSLDARGRISEPEETGCTFEENARIKAVTYAGATGVLTLAEDSGLEVDALGGAPGVYSARYAGIGSTRAERDRANNEKLLCELSHVPTPARAARFICAMCLARPDGTVIAETRGSFEGVITDQPRGSNGFGYDPLLLIPQVGRTSAELSAAEKNARSHRGMAARRMAAILTSSPLSSALANAKC